jgi:hypothetical protein
MRDKFKGWVKNLTWENYALIGIILVFCIIFGIYASSYKYVPSPVFGGDHYRDRGFVKNIAEGQPFWSDAFYLDELQYYGYLIPAIEGYFIKIFNTNVDKTFLYFPIFFFIIACISWYALGNQFFKDKKLGLLTVLAFISLMYGFGPKLGSVAIIINIPLILFFWLRYESDYKIWDGILAGIFLGLVVIIYGGIFVGMVASVAFSILILFLVDVFKDKKKFWHTVWLYIKRYYIMFIPVIIFALIYFAPLYFRYGLHIVNNVPYWGDAKASTLGFKWLFAILKNLFLDYSNLAFLMLSLISLAGIVGLSITKISREKTLFLALFFGNLIITHHYLLTEPILGKSFWPVKLIIYTYLMPIVFVYGAKMIAHYVSKPLTKKIDPEISKNVILGLIVAILLVAFIVKFNGQINSQWETYGREENDYTKALYNLAEYIDQNVKADEVILSNDESGFMLATLSGRKVMLTRRTHASYYVDIDKRIADAAVAMYGNNLTKTKEILQEYNVKYLYFDSQMMQYTLRTDLKYKDYLKSFDVGFDEAYDRYDIAVLPKDATMFQMILIPPQNISSEFLGLWEPVHNVIVQNQAVGQLARLRE